MVANLVSTLNPEPPLMALNALIVGGGAKHTHETCFKLHGYPDWWHELQARKHRDGNGGNIGQAVVAIVEPHLSLIPAAKSNGGNTGQAAVAAADPHSGNALLGSNQEANCNDWILDSGATDHMTFDVTDFSQQSPPRQTSIANANGDISSVPGPGIVMISLALSLSHTLLVPSLSHKLLFVSQITKALNCVVLIYPMFCLIQDILTKEIIGRGTEMGGLY